ncbi:unnamed protein product [Caenorhabditis angaria]|uniref:Uncharacterized protein n=1 Tax=Caenorhabditis angaria TaxID=860376 RepID=A0A9P1IDA3_9PELO|nr:unnamed protein product [Caenorhabditis angaria]
MRDYLIFLFLFLYFNKSFQLDKYDLQNRGDIDENLEEEEEDEQSTDKRSKSMYEFLYKRMNQDIVKKKPLKANVYMIPGPQEPLPGRTHMGDYFPVFPFQNQYSGGLDLDPSISRHIGGDFNFAIPSWGIMDIYGRFFNRIRDTTTKIGYVNHPVNMMDLEKEDLVRLMSDPSMIQNRNAQPTLPLGKFGKSYVPMSCKPPMCNPYHMNFGLGIEQDWGGSDGVEGDIDVPMPISKGIAYRFPFSGNVYAARDNITVTYGQNISPIEPFSSLFDYQKHRDPALRIPRKWEKRSIQEYPEEQIRKYQERFIERNPKPVRKYRIRPQFYPNFMQNVPLMQSSFYHPKRAQIPARKPLVMSPFYYYSHQNPSNVLSTGNTPYFERSNRKTPYMYYYY